MILQPIKPFKPLTIRVMYWFIQVHDCKIHTHNSNFANVYQQRIPTIFIEKNSIGNRFYGLNGIISDKVQGLELYSI